MSKLDWVFDIEYDGCIGLDFLGVLIFGDMGIIRVSGIEVSAYRPVIRYMFPSIVVEGGLIYMCDSMACRI